MKKTLLILFLAIGLVSFTTIINTDYTLTGTIKGLENGKTVTLERQDEVTGIVSVETVKLENEKFTFKGKALEPSIHFIQVQDVEGKIAFILENGKINFTIYKDSIGKSIISGTKNNEDLQNFNATAMKVQKKMQDFQAANMQKMQDAQANKDEATMNALMDEFGKIQSEIMTMTSTFPEKNPKSFLSVLFLDNMFNQQDVDIEKIKKIYNGLDASLKSTKPGKAIQTKINNFKVITVGSIAPEFSAPNPDGKVISLKESLGKITIIDFWASWCGPCRQENPSVVALYNEYHPKGLNIIGVSLDKDAAKWKDAIAKDNLTWSHISNLKFWQDPIAELYNVKSIPATFILDANGKIIARDLRGAELRAKVAELLK
ncbi:redoxin domain-containing protein [Flavobacterium sp. PLA-1-15]|uniref:redoxin domain-containing protein n=1 Tax=Flavobacterium sp. PLA-1-15 TaxID=3380533 RepID=UPI003B764EC8